MDSRVSEPKAAVQPPWPADRVIKTHELHGRPSKAPNHQAESAAMMELVKALAEARHR